MQSFAAAKQVTDLMDKKIWDFFWGKDESKTHHLFLKSRDTICRPKTLSSLGFQKMQDLNDAFLAKLGWLIMIAGHKTWVQLIRSKYLRG